MVPGISDRLLSQRLRELEAEGLVERSVHEGPPARVSYCLSETGEGLEPALRELYDWAHERRTNGAGLEPGRSPRPRVARRDPVADERPLDHLDRRARRSCAGTRSSSPAPSSANARLDRLDVAAQDHRARGRLGRVVLRPGDVGDDAVAARRRSVDPRRSRRAAGSGSRAGRAARARPRRPRSGRR